MSHNINITFLGTTSGGGPSETRNCSSLVVDALGDGTLWMVDCAEGTLRQFALQPGHAHDARRVRLSKLTKIFITHMHADHTMGILTLLRSVLGIPPPTSSRPATPAPPAGPPRIELYGPCGLRRLLRTLATLTHTHAAERYAVHELLAAGEAPSAAGAGDALADCEAPGRDVRCDAAGFWRGLADGGRRRTRVVVDAGPIEHRDPCLGYVFRETLGPSPRTLAVLGDTSDAAGLAPLLAGAAVALLVHEATDAHIPAHIDTQARLGRARTAAGVAARTVARGHSTPAMAGAFAARVGAQRLVLNHIGSRFPAPVPGARGAGESFRAACMREVERQATEAWAPRAPARAQVAWDFMRVVVPPNAPAPAPAEGVAVEVAAEVEAMVVEGHAGRRDDGPGRDGDTGGRRGKGKKRRHGDR